MITRRQFLAGLAGSLSLSAGGAGYVSRIEPRWLAISKWRVPLAKFSGGSTVRVLHLSDFHFSSVVPLDFIAESIERGLAERPDLIAVTGDFFTSGTHDVTSYAEVLGRLSAAAPTFACLGNHDGGPWSQRHGGIKTNVAVLGLLASAGILALVNESGAIKIKGRGIQLIGLADLWSGQCDPARAFALTPPRDGAMRLVLNHNPDAKMLLHPFDWDVMLSGHTHGGQVVLPFIGAPFAPVHDKRYLRGLYPWSNRWLHITSGVGNLHGIRFNCRPEVSVLEIG
jgi:predicted MPP superfamily phosphohydrolase